MQDFYKCSLDDAKEVVKGKEWIDNPDKPGDEDFRLYKVWMADNEENETAQGSKTTISVVAGVAPQQASLGRAIVDQLYDGSSRGSLAGLLTSKNLENPEEHKPTGGGRRPRGGGGRREKTETKETPEEKAEKDMNQVCKTWSQALGDDARGCQSMAVELQGLQKKQLAGHVEILGQHASTLREMRDKLDEKWSSKQWNEVKKFMDSENPKIQEPLND